MKSPSLIRCRCYDCQTGLGKVGIQTDLVLPKDVVHLSNIQVTEKRESGLVVLSERGRRVWLYTFEMRAGGFHETLVVTVEEGMSRAHIEDIIGTAQERFVHDVARKKDEKSGKHAPSPDEREDVSSVLKDLNAWRKKKRDGRAPILFVP